MTIKNKLEALHVLAAMRRMEINGDDCSKIGSKLYCKLYDAAETFFASNPCEIWEKFASNSNF